METIVASETLSGLGELRIAHPPGTFALTPASLICLEAIGKHQNLLKGNGLDWGSGTGCLAIAAAKIPSVRTVVGLEISEANVDIARENARRNGVENKVAFLLSDSYSPQFPNDRATLDSLVGKVNFILANPSATEGDDGFGFRRMVLQGARPYLANEGVVFVMVSIQYGMERIQQLCQNHAEFIYGGELASTDWVPFDLKRPDLLRNAHVFAAEELHGGLTYTFRHPDSQSDESMNAQAALAYFKKTGRSPLSKWQVHLFVFKRIPEVRGA